MSRGRDQRIKERKTRDRNRKEKWGSEGHLFIISGKKSGRRRRGQQAAESNASDGRCDKSYTQAILLTKNE